MFDIHRCARARCAEEEDPDNYGHGGHFTILLRAFMTGLGSTGVTSVGRFVSICVRLSHHFCRHIFSIDGYVFMIMNLLFDISRIWL